MQTGNYNKTCLDKIQQKQNFPILFYAFEKQIQYGLALHKKWNVPLRISSVNTMKPHFPTWTKTLL